MSGQHLNLRFVQIFFLYETLSEKKEGKIQSLYTFEDHTLYTFEDHTQIAALVEGFGRRVSVRNGDYDSNNEKLLLKAGTRL